MLKILSENFNKFNLINIFIALIPLSLILGNLAININIIIISLMGLFIYKNKIFIWEKKISKNLVYFFFIYIIIITFINNYPHLEENALYKTNVYKSFFFLRFLLLFLVINKLIEENKLNLKLFYISFSFFSCLISFDIIFQVISGKNLIGLPITFDRPSSFFGEENIAGGFLQKFTLFFIFLVLVILKNFKKKFSFLPDLIFLFFFFIIFLTGNRMPAIIFMFTIIIYYFFEKQFKKIFINFFLFLLIFLFLTQVSYNNINSRIFSFIVEVKNIILVFPKVVNINDDTGNFVEIDRKYKYLLHFNSAVQIWKKDKVFGHGLKSFRLNCKIEKNQLCNTHPHNYFLEILVDTGLVGLFLIYIIFINGLKDFIKTYRNSLNSQNQYKILLLPFFFIIFFEFFPFRSSGSFFSTTNAVTIFLILPFFLNIEKMLYLTLIKNKLK